MTGDYKNFVEGGFKSVGTSSPIDWDTAILIGAGIVALGGAITFFGKYVKNYREVIYSETKLKIIRGGIGLALDYAALGGVSADDAILLHKRFENYQDKGVEEVIEIIEGIIKLLEQPYPKPRNKIDQENRGRVITILEESLKAAGSSPLVVPEEDLVAYRENVEQIAKKFYDTYIMNGEYKKYSAFSNAKNAQDIKNILTSIFKNQMLTNYPVAEIKAKVAIEIIEEYFLIEFNADNPGDSIVKLKYGGASSAIVLEDEFKKVKDYAFNKFKSLEESLMLFKKGTAFERMMAARPNLRLRGGPFTGNISQSKDFPGLMMSIKSALQSAPKLFPGQVNLKQLGEIKQDLVNVIKPIGIQLQFDLFEYINEYVSKNPATASKLNRILQMIRSEKSMFGFPPAERSEVILEFTTDMIAFTDKQKAQDFSAKVDAWEVLSNFVLSSSSLTQDLPQAVDSPLFPGGIDFTRINYLTRPMGSFQGLDLRLPILSKTELEGIDIKQELAAMEQMINAKIEVSTDRLKRLLAAMSQKDAFTSQRETQLLPLLLRLCWLKEERGVETTPDFRAVLLIADSGLFVEQGNTRHSLN